MMNPRRAQVLEILESFDAMRKALELLDDAADAGEVEDGVPTLASSIAECGAQALQREVELLLGSQINVEMQIDDRHRGDAGMGPGDGLLECN